MISLFQIKLAMINIAQYLYFLQNCTGFSEKTTKNYTDFKRINECLQSLFPERKEFSLDDIEDPSELETIILQLQKLPLYIEYNEKGKNQYSATISTYLHFLYAKRMLLATKLNNISFEKKLIDSSRSNIPGEGTPPQSKSQVIRFDISISFKKDCKPCI